MRNSGAMRGIPLPDRRRARHAGGPDDLRAAPRWHTACNSTHMTAGDLCTRAVVTADPDETIVEAARRMRDRHVGALVIVDTAQRPLGILTDRDIVVSAVAQSPGQLDSLRVADLMTRIRRRPCLTKPWTRPSRACAQSASAACPLSAVMGGCSASSPSMTCWRRSRASCGRCRRSSAPNGNANAPAEERRPQTRGRPEEAEWVDLNLASAVDCGTAS